MIDHITFTGVDEKTSFRHIVNLNKLYPKVEFAVLVGSQTGIPRAPIFPRLEFVYEFKDFCIREDIQGSIHLCGQFARAVYEGEMATRSIYQLCGGFYRVQVNISQTILMAPHSAVPLRLAGFAESVYAEAVILQHQRHWSQVPVKHPFIEYLFDPSGGRGISSAAWPAPISGLGRIGYAGGLGPDNIDRALSVAKDYPGIPLWFDMESGLRTNGLFDLDKVHEVCIKVWPKT